MKKSIIFFSVVLIFFSCEKPEKEAVSGGKISYLSENYSLKKARIENYGDDDADGLKTLQLFFVSSNITMDEVKTSGTGTIFALEIRSLSDSLQNSVYQISDNFDDKTIDKENSYLKIITKEDTTNIRLSSGYLLVEDDETLFQKFEFHFIDENGDSISGNFRGKPLYNVLFDQPTVAQISVDITDYQIQKSDFLRWGKFLNNELYYYEICFYSADLRRTDDGKIKSGFVLNIGINSLSSDYPQNGTYQVSKNNEANTLLAQTKIGTATWGTYWNFYTSGSSTPQRGNVVSGSINFERIDDNFKITLNLKDHENNIISGEYDNVLNIRTMIE
ncbi:MAG: hypothetical protein LBN95_09965 [Prevotellaceae bacterium]|jgi:hypothetical protein|nr:hypothetical protein [Prevotellaceae bacterium]